MCALDEYTAINIDWLLLRYGRNNELPWGGGYNSVEYINSRMGRKHLWNAHTMQDTDKSILWEAVACSLQCLSFPPPPQQTLTPPLVHE